MLIKKLILFIMLSFCTSLFANYTVDSNSDEDIDIWVEELEGGNVIISRDTNFDGKVDSKLEMDAKSLSIYEESDFDLDGAMDNFYYYENGIIIRQEVDSNYDNKIDVWVHIVNEGKTISRYEKDLDYDGVIDKVKDFEVKEENG